LQLVFAARDKFRTESLPVLGLTDAAHMRFAITQARVVASELLAQYAKGDEEEEKEMPEKPKKQPGTGFD
jgi:hypothetical protein